MRDTYAARLESEGFIEDPNDNAVASGLAKRVFVHKSNNGFTTKILQLSPERRARLSVSCAEIPPYRPDN